MSFLNKFLFFSFLAVFVSCAPHKKEYKKRTQGADKMFNLVLFDMFSETIDKYREVIELLKEERNIYDEMIDLSYRVNRMHNKIIGRQQLGLDSLNKLKRQIIDLEDMLFDSTGPIPEGVFEKLSAIEASLKFMEDLISGVETVEREELYEEEIYYLEEEAVSGDQEVEEPVSEGPAEVSVEEEAVSGDQEVVESVSEGPAEVSVEEEAVSGDQEVEEPVSEGLAEVSVEEEAVSGDQEATKSVSEEPAEVSVEEEAVSGDQEVVESVSEGPAEVSVEEEAVSGDQEVAKPVSEEPAEVSVSHELKVEVQGDGIETKKTVHIETTTDVIEE